MFMTRKPPQPKLEGLRLIDPRFGPCACCIAIRARFGVWLAEFGKCPNVKRLVWIVRLDVVKRRIVKPDDLESHFVAV